MNVTRNPKEYYDRFADKPVEIKPFDAESKRQSDHYLAQLNAILAPLGVRAELHGSVALGVDGKGEWEFALWLTNAQWYPVLKHLINHYGSIFELDQEFALFADTYTYENGQEGSHDEEVEVILMRGEVARQNQAVMHYWRTHPDALAAYAQGKYAHAHSKRNYYWWKDNLIADILESL